MKIQFKNLAVFVLFVSGFFLFAQEKQPEEGIIPSGHSKLVLTVEDAVEYAAKNNKSLKSAAIALEMKKRADSNSWNTFLPGLQVSATAARTNTNSTYNSIYSGIITQARLGALENGSYLPPAAYDSIVKGAGYSDEEKLHWAVVAPSLSFSWVFNLAMVDSIRAAKAQYEAGLISWEKTEREMEVNIRKLFYGLLLSQENLSIQKEKLYNARERYNQAAINYRNGLVPELSVLNAQVTYENQKPTVMSTEQSVKQSKDMFAFLLGLPFGSEIELEGSVGTEYVEVNAGELVEKYLSENKDILAVRKNIELLKISIEAARFSTFTPSLSVNWGFSPAAYAAGEWADSLSDADSGRLSFTLVYSNLLDMLPFSSNMQKLKDTKQQLAQAELGYEQLKQNTEIEIYTLVDNLNKCWANIKAMNGNVDLARRAYESTLKSYRNGTTEWLEVQESENSYNQARLGLSNEKYNYISALLDLETKLNIKLRKQ